MQMGAGDYIAAPGTGAAHRATSEQLRAGFAELGLTLLLEDAPLSYTITTLLLPEGWSYPALHDAL